MNRATLDLTPLYAAIADVPDFPQPGITFKDITPLLRDGPLFRGAMEALADEFRGANVTQVVAIESRGFIIGTAIAHELSAGLVLVRKPGKLPRETCRVEYELEYGTDALEIHRDAVGPDDRVVIVDDVLATGGTAAAAAELVRETGANLIGFGILIELGFLRGRARLGETPIQALLRYD